MEVLRWKPHGQIFFKGDLSQQQIEMLKSIEGLEALEMRGDYLAYLFDKDKIAETELRAKIQEIIG